MSFRIGNTADSLNNRKNFLFKNGIDFKNHICMKCDHGEKIIAINRDTSGIGAITQEGMILTEVLVTQEKGLALMLLTADCLPVSFYDPTTQTIALAHFSRETISNMLPQKTMCFLRTYFLIKPENLMVYIGPHIHVDSYSFALPQPDLSPIITPFISKNDTYVHIDLVSACTDQLTKEGVDVKNISISEINTAHSSNHFSHYQSRKENTQEGRLATVLMMT